MTKQLKLRVWKCIIKVTKSIPKTSIVSRIIWKQTKDSLNVMSTDLIPDVDSRKAQTYLAFAILSTVVTLIIILIIFVMRKRIQLVVQLFEESGKAIAVMPILLFQPILVTPFTEPI